MNFWDECPPQLLIRDLPLMPEPSCSLFCCIIIYLPRGCLILSGSSHDIFPELLIAFSFSLRYIMKIIRIICL